MKVFHWILGIVTALSLIIILLISSFEIAAYGDYGFYKKEYIKYHVLDDVDMEMSDVMTVTREMMAYLRGGREDLVVKTIVADQEREFFNDREKAHMADVKDLFLQGLALRTGAIIVAVISMILLLILKADQKTILPQSFLFGTAGFLVVTGGLVALFAIDFTKYFTIFHEIFFTNDLWLLDPATDLMINILPEGFFMDMAARIGLLFAASMILVLTLSIILYYRGRKKLNKN